MTSTGRCERVTFELESGRRRTIYLRDVQVVDTPVLGEVLMGVEVDAEGDEVAPRGVDERRHVIGTEAIVRRVPVVMDRLYGRFVLPGEEMCG